VITTPLAERVAQAVATYDSHGDHRTATPADEACCRWLTAELHAIGVEPSIEPFPVDRLDPQNCVLRVAERTIEGVPMFDAGCTGAAGISGRLGLAGTDATIALAHTAPSQLRNAGSERERALAAGIRDGRHEGVVLVTAGKRPGLCLLNAPLFTEPSGPPTLQVSSVESEWLKQQAAQHAAATLIVHTSRAKTEAHNVTVMIKGADSALPPLVVTTPRSGWWRCASERGGGLACWLEAVRAVAAARPVRDCHFAALSAHELGALGMLAYLRTREHLLTGAVAWIQLGANIGAPGQPNQVCASDEALETWATSTLASEGIPVNMAPRGAVPFGEARHIQMRGGRFVAVICDSEVFHHPDDRWPVAVDVPLLLRYAHAFANGIVRLAQASS
jgi:hypothetical protein